jgi:predicted RecA/RadA family phage recombinase
MTKRFSHPGEIVATVPAVTVRSGDLYAWGAQVGIATHDSDPTGLIGSRTVDTVNQIALVGVHYMQCTAGFAPTDGQQLFAVAAAGVTDVAAAGARFIGHAIVLPPAAAARVYDVTPPNLNAGKAYVLCRLVGGAQATF